MTQVVDSVSFVNDVTVSGALMSPGAGVNSFKAGTSAIAAGVGAIAIGDVSQAAANSAVVIGDGANALGGPSRGYLNVLEASRYAAGVDTDTFILNDGTNPAVTFVYDDDFSVAETPTLRAIAHTGVESSTAMRMATVTAINNAPTLAITATNKQSGFLTLVNDVAGTSGNQGISDTIVDTGWKRYGMFGGTVDATPTNTVAVGTAAFVQDSSCIAIGNQALAHRGGSVAIGSVVFAHIDTIAIGDSVEAWGASSVAVGNGAFTYGDGSIAIGEYPEIEGGSDFSVAIGSGAQVRENSAKSCVFGTGTVNSDSPDSIAMGSNAAVGVGIASPNAIAIGNQSDAIGVQTIALGYMSQATAASAISIGDGAVALSDDSIAIGRAATITDNSASDAIAIGQGATIGAGADFSIVIGSGAGATGSSAEAVAIGRNASADGIANPIAIGAGAKADQAGAIAIGSFATVDTTGNGMAIGLSPNAQGSNSIAFGRLANTGVGATGALAFGPDTDANGIGSLALGIGSQATATGAVAVGRYAAASGTAGVSIGSDSIAVTAAVAVGEEAFAQSTSAIAIGDFADVGIAATASIAIGSGATVINGVVGGVVFGGSSSVQEDGGIAFGDNADVAAEHTKAGAIGSGARSYQASTVVIGSRDAEGATPLALATTGGLEIFDWKNTVDSGDALTSIRHKASIQIALSGVSVTAVGLIPAGSILIAVSTRVRILIAGATGYDIGDGSDVNRWGDNIAVAAGTTSDLTDGTIDTSLPIFSSAGDVVLTARGSNFTAGTVIIVVHYILPTASIS